MVTRLDDLYFTLDDGSGIPVQVADPYHTLQTGDYAEARGQWFPAAGVLQCYYPGWSRKIK
jgi:hypothetical protein